VSNSPSCSVFQRLTPIWGWARSPLPCPPGLVERVVAVFRNNGALFPDRSIEAAKSVQKPETLSDCGCRSLTLISHPDYTAYLGTISCADRGLEVLGGPTGLCRNCKASLPTLCQIVVASEALHNGTALRRHSTFGKVARGCCQEPQANEPAERFDEEVTR